MLLKDATEQEIFLELIKRTDFNSFYGEDVYNFLIENKNLYSNVVFGRYGEMSLIILRDVNFSYNADSIYLIAKDEKSAQKIIKVAKKDLNCDEAFIVKDKAPDYKASMMMGSSNISGVLVSLWWD